MLKIHSFFSVIICEMFHISLLSYLYTYDNLKNHNILDWKNK